MKNLDPNRARRIFKWIATARRPLTLEELREAIGIEPGQTDLVAARLVNNMRQALACCGSLVTVDEEQYTVHFAHHSIKQHLISEPTEGALAQYHISMPEAELEAGQSCVTYLNFSMFDRRVRKIPQPGMASIAYPAELVKQTLPRTNLAAKVALNYLKDRKFPSAPVHRQLEDTAESSSLQQNHLRAPFLGYAREFWIFHCRTLKEDSKQIWRLWSRLIENETGINDKPWTTLDWGAISTKVIQFIADNDHEALLCCVLAKIELLSVVFEQWWDTPTARKFRHIVRTIFTKKRPDLVQSLLKAPKKQSLQNELYIPIIIHGDLESFKFNQAQGGFWNFAIPPGLAAEYNINVLEYNSVSFKNPEVFDVFEGNWTPLMVAVKLGRTDLVQYMLLHSSDSAGWRHNLVDWELNRHFSLAMLYGFKDIAMLLLQGDGFEPNQTTANGWTPLFYAAFKGNSDIAVCLVGKGANVLHRANDGRSIEDVARDAGHCGFGRSFLNGLALVEFTEEVSTAAAVDLDGAANREATAVTSG